MYGTLVPAFLSREDKNDEKPKQHTMPSIDLEFCGGRQKMRPSFRKVRITSLSAALLACGAVPSFGQFTGPSSSQSPYVVPANPSVITKAIMTVGDSVNLKPDGVTPYRAVGIMDGMGAYDNGDGTFTLVLNHEINAGLGIARAHGNNGAFVSRWIIKKSDLEVLKVEDLLPSDTSIFLSNNNPSSSVPHTGFLPGASTILSRLCSADLAPQSAYGWTDPATGIFYGTTALIFQTGEESGGTQLTPNGPEARIDFGRQFNMILTDDPNTPGDDSRTAYEMPHCGIFGWENNLASPFPQKKTITMGMDDTTPGQIYVWVGEKRTSGNVVERAGLTRQGPNDNLYVIKVANAQTGGAAGSTLESRSAALSGTFTLENEGDVSALTGAQLEALSDSKGGTEFLRPEDGHWDPTSPSDYYFVTTDRYDQVKDSVGTQVGRSRLYRLRFSDITQPENGGTIECLLDGTESGNMFDNMTLDRHGRVFIQEDVGGQAHNGKIWMYDIVTDKLTLVALHDPARFGNIGVLPVAPFNNDEESSGIIDASGILGTGWLLLDVQAHYGIAGELVEGGQLVAMHVPLTGDLNNDGFRNAADLALLQPAIRARSTNPIYDLNGDGRVDIADARWLTLHYTK